MPEIFQNTKYWLRVGGRNEKRHVDMSDEEKANVATCKGIKDKHICKNPLFRCSKCGNYGCDQVELDVCTEQGFKNDKCLNCGLRATRIPIMKDDYEKFVKAWEEEVPLV